MGTVKYSYSRLSTYGQCPWKYKLKYVDFNFVPVDSIAIDLGTLIHFIEEHISYALMKGEKPDYDKLIDDFRHINRPKTGPQDMDGGQLGIEALAKKYPFEFYATDENGSSYATRCEWYANEGIYRQEKFLEAHPTYKLFDVERYFEFTFEGHILKGYIDRIWYDTETDQYIIDDIKTKNKLFDEEETKTPMQHCIYAMALKSSLGLDTEPTQFFYDLPFVNTRQPLGTMHCISRAQKKLRTWFDKIDGKPMVNGKPFDLDKDQWKPSPSALCYWCEYGGMNPHQPKEGKHLCPYYALWKQGDKYTGATLNTWGGMHNHERVMDQYLNVQCDEGDGASKEFDISCF